MTMLRAIALLVASIAVLGGGIVVLAVKIDAGFLSPEAGEVTSGARTGDQAATPADSGGQAAQEVRATLTAIARTLTAAVPGVTGTPVPAGASAVRPGEPITVGVSTFTVLGVVDPEPPGFFVTNPGMRRVAVLVEQEATGGPARYSFGLFRIRDSAGDEHSWAITNSDPGFDTGELARGESHLGWVSFQIPEGRAPVMLMVNAPGGHTDIVRLD